MSRFLTLTASSQMACPPTRFYGWGDAVMTLFENGSFGYSYSFLEQFMLIGGIGSDIDRGDLFIALRQLNRHKQYGQSGRYRSVTVPKLD